ncbi:MAG: YbdK family carboxylate-amine ligase, partial [Pseudomonadota bacterium]
MTRQDPNFTIGVEEEYLLVDRDSLALAEAPEALMDACAAELEGQVAPEFLKCQIEIGTKVCGTIADAREDLKRLRSCVAKHAGAHNLAPIAASCHPFSDWRDQAHTDKERYNTLSSDLGGVVQRMLICGMHVHVCIEEPDRRVDLMNQLTYFLPHLLALSCSSPYWQGRDTGL